MGIMRFAPTWLRQVRPLLHKTTLTTDYTIGYVLEFNVSTRHSIGPPLKCVGGVRFTPAKNRILSFIQTAMLRALSENAFHIGL